MKSAIMTRMHFNRPSILSVLAVLSILSPPPADAQNANPKPHPKVDQKQVDDAVDRAGTFLLDRLKAGKLSTWLWGDKTSVGTYADEFVLYTLIYAGVPKNSPDFQKALTRVLNRDHAAVYQTAVTAMLLAEIDRAKYQTQIALCAQFLVDAQCENGQWDYAGEKLDTPEYSPDVAAGKPEEAATGTPGTKPVPRKTTALKSVPIKRQKKGPAAGNNSTTQLALLGLRSCMSASVKVPADVFARSEAWWRKNQNNDGGWGYGDKGAGGSSYGSMTAGALGSLAICDYYLGRDAKTDRDIQKGAKWFEEADHWGFDKNPRHGMYHYYWFYALERAGVLIGADLFSGHDWYKEGADWLLAKQEKDGRWNNPDWVEDTCYAVLFLRRATKPLTKVYSGQ